ncbi:MAG TPA: 16S rRNA (cytosine(1402)-N(4))-methyltransferase RsmH [Candidatus Saccharimonadales bacterium]|nr:16S rRNA (cytosine(1402)-N(4))-methyltransferase RsmH [Candidatus Saccharimonadales bacterium]
MRKNKHEPVLAEEVIRYLQPKPKDRYLDLTAGYGGHARMILDRIGEEGTATLVDRDEYAVKSLQDIFAEDRRVGILHRDFLSASKQLSAEKKEYDIILADLGLSSPHIDNPQRGFSFAASGPLDMRMDRSQELTAGRIINTYDAQLLADIFREYGEIRNARKLAERLVEQRPYETTDELAKKIAQLQGRKGRIHPATKVFQALRIAVNNELAQLEEALPLWISMLARGGRIGVISFHSLEDRLVKQAFKDYGGNRYDAGLHIVTKKVVTAGKNEVVFNPRSRSAKLRVAQRK